jgi:hypothetical protein
VEKRTPHYEFKAGTIRRAPKGISDMRIRNSDTAIVLIDPQDDGMV